jgi:hypothetical protein
MQSRKEHNLISLTPGFSQVWLDSTAPETVLTVYLRARKTVEMVSNFLRHVFTSLKRGVNENSLCVFAPLRLCVKNKLTNV